MSTLAKRMTPTETKRRTELEAVVRRGQKAFQEVWNALSEISESRLFRSTHETFAAYCAEVLGISARHGYRMLKAAEVGRNLAGSDTDLCDTVSHSGLSLRAAQELAELRADDQKKAWALAKQGSSSPTVRETRAAVEQVVPLTKGMSRLERERHQPKAPECDTVSHLHALGKQGSSLGSYTPPSDRGSSREHFDAEPENVLRIPETRFDRLPIAQGLPGLATCLEQISENTTGDVATLAAWVAGQLSAMAGQIDPD